MIFYCGQWFGCCKWNQRYVVKGEKDRKEEIVGWGEGFLGQQDGPVGEQDRGYSPCKLGNLGAGQSGFSPWNPA